MPTPPMTEKEIIDYLGKTSLPTLLVEGKDDAIVYRWLEAQLGIFTGSILVCSGRDVLVSIYRKRDTFPHGKVAWLADLDMWRFSAPPDDLAGIVFTAGYSIENDLYAGSAIETLLEDAERSQHSRLLAVLCRWFAFEVLEHQSGRPSEVGHQINAVIDYDLMDISHRFRTKRGFAEPDAKLVDSIFSDYKMQLRGKTLLQALIRFLSAPNRSSKYSYAAIVELCLKLYPDNPHIKRIVAETKRMLS